MALTKIPGSLLDTTSGINGLIYPTSDGTAGQFLKTDGSGNLAFATVTTYTDSDVETYLDGGTSTPTFASATVSGALTVTGDLNITGDINSYNVTDLDVTDQTITLGAGQIEANSGGSGIIIDGSSASILWDETNDTFDINKGIDVTGTATMDGLVVQTGSGTLTTSAFGGSSVEVASSGAYKHSSDISSGYHIFEVNSLPVAKFNNGGDISFYEDTGTTAKFFWDASTERLGIGTTSPSKGLHLNFSNDIAAIRFQNTTNAKVWDLTPAIPNVANSGFSLYNVTDNTVPLHVDNSGNVGIGTATPGAKLHVVNAATEEYIFETTSNNTRSQVEVKSKDSSGNAVQARLSTMGDGTYGMLYTFTNHNLTFATNNAAPQMTLNTSGNVGIGTTSPSTRTHIYSSASSTPLIVESTANTYVGIKNTTQTAYIGAVTSNMIFENNGAERMRIDSSGNVGIGLTSNSTYPLQISASGTTPSLAVGVTTNSNGIIQILSTNTGAGTIHFGDSESIWDGYISYGHSNQALNFGVNGVTKMSLMHTSQSNGALRIGTTSPLASSNEKMTIQGSAGLTIKTTDYYDYAPLYLWQDAANATNSTTNIYAAFISHNDVTVGSITSVGSTTSYNTTSDYRLKENVDYTWDATTRLKQLKPARFNFTINADTIVDGFLAHEVQDIVPEAITGEKDAMKDEEYEITPAVLDEDGNVVTEAVRGTRTVPNYQSIDQSKLVPLLVKTIQELEERITTLENA